MTKKRKHLSPGVPRSVIVRQCIVKAYKLAYGIAEVINNQEAQSLRPERPRSVIVRKNSINAEKLLYRIGPEYQEASS